MGSICQSRNTYHSEVSTFQYHFVYDITEKGLRHVIIISFILLALLKDIPIIS